MPPPIDTELSCVQFDFSSAGVNLVYPGHDNTTSIRVSFHVPVNFTLSTIIAIRSNS